MKKILFVCLGNICRSPLAEGIFAHLVSQANLSGKYTIDSAGTSSYHVGAAPDKRMIKTSQKNGIELNSFARKVEVSDFDNFDLILAMDRSNFNHLEQFALKNNKRTDNIQLMRMYDENPDDFNVPDPYFGGQKGFDNVFDIIHRSCVNMLHQLEE